MTEELPKETTEIKPHPYGVELGILARAFDAMTHSLQQNKESLNQSLVALKQREQDLYITLNSIGDAVIATNGVNLSARTSAEGEEEAINEFKASRADLEGEG